MSDIHITRELLRAFSRGELPVRTLIQLGLDHLRALCPLCREEVDAWWREQRQPGSYEQAFASLQAVLEHQAPRIEAAQRRAKTDLAELKELPSEDRLAKIERARTRFRGVAMMELLLRESRACLPADASASYHYAELARAVAQRSPHEEGIMEQWALAAALKANARRVQGDRREAGNLFAHARSIQRRYDVADPLVTAELDGLEASLRKDERRFDEAARLLQRAELTLGVLGDRRRVARVLLQLGEVYRDRGEPERAWEAASRALSELDPEQEPRLYLTARHNLAHYLCDAGRYEEAREALAANHRLYEGFTDSWTRLRVRWLEGKIARGLGEEEGAEEAFRAVRDGFLAEGNGYDAALASLDLALLYLDQGRTGEVQRLAGEMVPIFEAQDVHREAVAALMLFRRAAEAEALTRELVEKVLEYLEQSRRDPALRFEEPS